MRQSSGVRIERALAGTFPKDTQIRPLRDHLVVKVTEWSPSTILEVEYHGKPLRGVVTAAGPGCYPKRYNATRSRTWDSKAFRPTDTQVGDTVELGGLELRGYDFPQLLIGNELHVICREEDVVGIVEPTIDYSEEIKPPRASKTALKEMRNWVVTEDGLRRCP